MEHTDLTSRQRRCKVLYETSDRPTLDTFYKDQVSFQKVFFANSQVSREQHNCIIFVGSTNLSLETTCKSSNTTFAPRISNIRVTYVQE
jgi:hypothetical protein